MKNTPRDPAGQERELLTHILSHGSEIARSYLPQIEGIRVFSSCSCGCPTVRLVPVDSTPLGRTDGSRILCDLEGRTKKGELVGVLLFQDAGKLAELEAYSIDGQLESTEFEFPVIDTLQPLQVSNPSTEA